MKRVVKLSRGYIILASLSMWELVSVSNCCTPFNALSWSSSRCSILSSRMHIVSMDAWIVCSILCKSLSELMELVGWLIVFEFTV